MRILPSIKTWLSLYTTCNIQSIDFNREHVIPRSIVRDNSISNTEINVIPFPSRINSARGNRKMIDQLDYGKRVWPCKDCSRTDCNLTATINGNEYTPPVAYKPILGASVMITLMKNPHLLETIHYQVLDLGTALTWVNSSYEQLPTDIKDAFKI